MGGRPLQTSEGANKNSRVRNRRELDYQSSDSFEDSGVGGEEQEKGKSGGLADAVLEGRDGKEENGDGIGGDLNGVRCEEGDGMGELRERKSLGRANGIPLAPRGGMG